MNRALPCVLLLLGLCPRPARASDWNAGGGWTPVGTGDCPGRDVAGTNGPTPDAAKCTAAYAGFTAVCWAGNCTYKDVAAGTCKGGANPGQMYTCAPGRASAAPASASAPEAWTSVGTGDCPGRDVAETKGPTPDPAKCNATFAGFTAVCWDGACTYKNLATSACTGGASPGRMYTCAAGPVATPIHRPATGTWAPVGTGDCPGSDVAGTTGPTPDPARCTAGFAGFTAVCWAGNCTYKNVATPKCTGGSNPGRMYSCSFR